MNKTELRSLIREEIKKTLKEGAGFDANNLRHQKAAIALSEFLKTKIATYMDPSDCASLLYNMAKSLDNEGDYEDGLDYFSKVS